MRDLLSRCLLECDYVARRVSYDRLLNLWHNLTDWLRSTLGPPIKALLAPFDQFLVGLPLWVAQAAVLGLFLLAGVWVWLLPRKYIYLGAPDQARWRDLRIWATLVLIPYMAIYLVLGR